MPKTLTLVGGALVTGCLLAVPLDGQDKASPVAAVLKMQKAVSGVTKVNSLILEGEILAEVNANIGQVIPTPAPIEIRVLLPTHYLRAVERVSGTLRQDGFSGLAPRNASTPLTPGGVANLTGADPYSYLPAQRAAAARLLLGVTGMLDGPLALKAEPDGTPSTLHVTGPDNFDGHIDVAADTGMPLRVRYEARCSSTRRPPKGSVMPIGGWTRRSLPWALSTGDPWAASSSRISLP